MLIPKSTPVASLVLAINVMSLCDLVLLHANSKIKKGEKNKGPGLVKFLL